MCAIRQRIKNSADTARKVQGPVAPIPVRNKEFSIELASALKKPFWFPNVPKFMLQLLFGEMSIVILGSTKASSQPIEDAGFEFQFRTLDKCLKNLVENK